MGVGSGARVAGAAVGVLACLLLLGCTDGPTRGDRTGPSTGPTVAAPTAPFETVIDAPPGPVTPPLRAPARAPGEHSRTVVSTGPAGLDFRDSDGADVRSGEPTVIEASCSARTVGRVTRWVVYDARPGAWGRGTALLTHPFPCDGSVTTVEVTTLPAGRMHVALSDLPADTLGAYAALRPSGPGS
ncbi:MAG: hypothetical protein ABIS35_02945 [Terracoccus sp.]